MKLFIKKKPIDYIIYSLIIVVGIIVDQISKWLIFSNMEIGQSIPIIKDVLHITYVTNDGAAFGMFDGPVERLLVMIVTTILVIGFSVYLYLGHAENIIYAVAMSLVVSGGIGNMIDRLGFGFYVNSETGMGEVIDFINFCAFPKIWNAIFNVADAFVCIGAGLLVLALVIDMINEAKGKKADAQPAAEGAEQTSDEEEKAE